MKSVGIFICNYNKREFVVNCIKSILNQSFQDFDLYVIDNASQDDSVEVIRREFGDKVNLIVNAENLGGSGGFNTGLRKGLAVGYPYLMLVDNDVVMDQDAVQSLYDFMKEHPEVGVGGAKILRMDIPDMIQDLGAMITFDNYFVKPCFGGERDREDLPEIKYCDYVSACTLMARREAVEQVGVMPEDNFIYWDDMEWGYMFNRAGYKVAACNKAKVWHRHTIANPTNTFVRYYMNRNRINFFAKALPEEALETFIDYILNESFRELYGSHYKNKVNLIKSSMYALDDAIHRTRGKADPYKILPKDEAEDCMVPLLKGVNTIGIRFIDQYDPQREDVKYYNLIEILCRIRKLSPDSSITVSVKDSSDRSETVMEKVDFLKAEKDDWMNYIRNIHYVDDFNGDQDLLLQMCEHVNKVTDKILPVVYIDKWCNYIASEKDYLYFANYNNSREFFFQLYKPLFVEGVKKIREANQ